MGFFRKLFRREFRAAVVTADDNIMRIINSVEVSPETAMEIPAVSACVGFISYCIASLPIKLYREDREKNVTEEIKNDPRLRLLNDETGDLLDPFQMKQAVIEDFFLHGAGFIYPEMYGNEFISLRYIDHNHISSINRGVDPVFKSGQYVLSNGMELWDDRVIKFLRETKDGLTGKSIIDQHQQILSAMYKEIVYEKLLVASGGNKKGFITAETKLSDESMAELRKAWNQMYANTGNTMMILNKGLAFHESSNTSVEMQLLENKVRNNELICQLFGMSPGAASGTLSDDELTSAIKSAVVPVITAFENALDRGLLLPSERDLMYYNVDTTELLRGDILKRYQAYKLGLESNVLQIDEVRYKEDLPPLGLHWIKLGLQDVLFDPKTKTIYTPNMNQTMQMSETRLPAADNAEKDVDKPAQGGIIEERDNQTRIVCVWGSPLSGKTTYVGRHAGKNDIIWDWDRIKQAVSFSDDAEEAGQHINKMLLRLRASFMRAAADCGAETAWFICTRPNDFIRDMLGANAEYIKMDVSKEECLKRLAEDNTRRDKQKQAGLIEAFFREEGHEEREAVFGEGHKIVDNVSNGGGGSGGGRQEGASGQSEKTVTNAAGQTVRIVDYIRLTGEQPNSITQRQNANGGIDRNYYDEKGRQVKQISNHDHGHPKQHPFGKHGEHAHDYVLDKNGVPRHCKPRELNDDERKDNGDML